MSQNVEGKNERYYAALIEDVEFSENELSRMDIAFINSPGELKEGLLKLGVEMTDASDELIDYGYALVQVGSVKDPHWAVYSLEWNLEYILDIWGRRNFYNISRETKDGPKIIFRKAYLRERSMEEDITYYIELDVKSRYGPYDVADNIH